MQHELSHLHYVCQDYTGEYPEVQDEEPYYGHNEGDFMSPKRLIMVWAGIPMPTTCPITEDYINDPCHGPLCAHFHAFGQVAYITKALGEHKAKTNGMLQRLLEIGWGLTLLLIFKEEDKELKLELQFKSINKLGMLQLHT